jgi:RHS repeat-associated protein
MATTSSNKYLFSACLSGDYLSLDVYSLTPASDGKSVDITLSTHTFANLQGVLPLSQWTHIVFQGAGLNRNNLAVYVNGKSCPLVTTAPPGDCGWEIASTTTSVIYPENFASLKHLRLYNRLLSAAEIAANAGEPCLSISPAYATGLNNALLHWSRFNIPAAGAPGTIGDGSTTETQYIAVYPAHKLTTSYTYQSLNGVETQNSPDGGLSRFWYDRLGRMVVSQNAEQLTPTLSGIANRYSYNLYDEQGRITEVGEKYDVLTQNRPTAKPFLSSSETNMFQFGGTVVDITRTHYDAIYTEAGTEISSESTNLRKRVAAVTLHLTRTSAAQDASYYSYDQLGNVKTLWQQIEDLGIKKIEYQYDLVSGKVNKVRYQQGKTDRFFYGYQYDAENRLTKAVTDITSTSSDGWEIEHPHTDAAYQYFLHGPLARTELGNEHLVQGMDYAYTLQGWLKGVNGNYLLPGKDIGKDGVGGEERRDVGRDAYAFSLDYFKGDYKPIGGSTADAFSLNWIAGQNAEVGRDLYNGNISRSTLALKRIKEETPVGYSYRYDQLNRLMGMRQHPLTIGATGWNAATAGEAFKEAISYDGNGNILTYLRNGSDLRGTTMDQLSYVYSRDAAGNLLNNRLLQVQDAVNNAAYTEDLKSQVANNYVYNKIGNLVADKQTDGTGTSQITWSVYGKIKRIFKGDGSVLIYRYDAAGNRVYKQYSRSGRIDKTWYVRDAQGNTLAVYGNKDGGTPIYWKEQHLYGSSRLGIWNVDMELSAGNSSTKWQELGNKSYELSNHLGNVLATISDKPVDVVSGGVIDHYEAEVLSAQDYYPFGMLQPDRKWSLGNYRYGFNGKENDNEVKGEGNQQDYGMRVYDPRIGKFLSVDPLTKDYPWNSTYSFAEGDPINFIDLDGGEKSKSHLQRIIELDLYILGRWGQIAEGDVHGENSSPFEEGNIARGIVFWTDIAVVTFSHFELTRSLTEIPKGKPTASSTIATVSLSAEEEALLASKVVSPSYSRTLSLQKEENVVVNTQVNKSAANGGTRPTWQQSEQDIVTPDYKQQVSFKNGRIIDTKSKGSVRPEGYKPGASIEVKNYNLTTEKGIKSMLSNVVKQVRQRQANLPKNTTQNIMLDVRGQNLGATEMQKIRSRLATQAGDKVNVSFKTE